MEEKSRYAQAGVDFEKEHEVVDIFRALREATLPFTADLRDVGISFPEDEGDFSGGFHVDVKKLLENGIESFVSQECVDGPGSKPVVHALYDGNNPMKLGCTSIDSIAMVVNDLICSGARPVTLVEYHSWHNTHKEIANHLARGNLFAAELAMATIIGGENASLSAMITGPFPDLAYDMCHMAHGVIFDSELIQKPLGKGRVQEGDIVIGLSSSGIHCNGITLAWKTAIGYDDDISGVPTKEELMAVDPLTSQMIALTHEKKEFYDSHRINDQTEELGGSVAEAILTPTIIYVRPVLEILNRYGSQIHAIANITGEGVHNLFRVLPKDLSMSLDYSKDKVQKPHPIFNWIQRNADVPTREMYEDYNMGTGMVIVVDGKTAPAVISDFNGLGQQHKQPFSAYNLGDIGRYQNREIRVKTASEKMEVYEKR